MKFQTAVVLAIISLAGMCVGEVAIPQGAALATNPFHFDRKCCGVGPADEFARRYLADHPGETIGLVPCAVAGKEYVGRLVPRQSYRWRRKSPR